MANFVNTKRPTPFGFYDADPVYQKDADKIIYFVLRKLGEDILSVELTKHMIWSCFEEATFVFNANIIEYQAKSNLASLLGTTTGSVDPNDPNTANTTPNLTNVYIKPNLEFLIRQAEPYASEIGFGQSKGSVSGSIVIQQGRQDYDLYTDLVDDSGVPIANQMISGSKGKMKVVEVFHHAPLQYVFNSNLASNFVASGLPVESYVPDTRFYILPLFEDVLRASMLKEAQRTRRSHYRYKISGRQIRFYPIPREFYDGIQNRIWIRVVFPSNPVLDAGLLTPPSGSVAGDPGTPEWSGGVIHPDDSIYGVTNPANLPYGLVTYAGLNPWAKNWIFQYTLALCTELLGRVRGKLESIPFGGGELKLDADYLRTAGKEEKDALLRGEHGLVAKLESLTYEKLAEMEANKAELQQKQLQYIPFPPTVTISVR